MKIAYLITAYTDPRQLRRLIDALNVNAHFYIHVDLKVDCTPFEQELCIYGNVQFTNKRFFTNWGSFAQVLYQQELIACAVQSTIPFDRVVCLSATDYPLWSNKQIAKEFSINLGREYIQAVNLTKLNNPIQTRKVVLYHFLRDVPVKSTFLKKCFSGSARAIMKALPFRKKPTTWFDGREVDVFFGSDYWALTMNCARYVHEKLASQHALMTYFRSSYIPSEMCIHTIIFNSPYAKHGILTGSEKYDNLHSLTPLHHIEYHGAIKVFDERDYDQLAANEKMFFRKALTGKSDKLAEKIDVLRAERDAMLTNMIVRD